MLKYVTSVSISITKRNGYLPIHPGLRHQPGIDRQLALYGFRLLKWSTDLAEGALHVSLRLESNYCLSINDNKLRLFFSTTWLRGCKLNCYC
jgi:hypothetical protein